MGTDNIKIERNSVPVLVLYQVKVESDKLSLPSNHVVLVSREMHDQKVFAHIQAEICQKCLDESPDTLQHLQPADIVVLNLTNLENMMAHPLQKG